MKRIIALILVLSMCISLCACGSEEEPVKEEPEESIEDMITSIALLELYSTIKKRVEHRDKDSVYKYCSKTNIDKTRYEVTLFQEGGTYTKDCYKYTIQNGYKVCGKFALYDDYDNPIGKDYYGKGTNVGTFEIVVTSSGTIEYSNIQ